MDSIVLLADILEVSENPILDSAVKFFGTATLLGPAVWWVASLLYRGKLRNLTEEKDRNKEFATQSQNNEKQALVDRNVWKSAADERQQIIQALSSQLENTAEELACLSGKLEATEAELGQHQSEQRKVKRLLANASKMEGHLWTRKSLQSRPKFKSLNRRQRPIISVLNIKGGVGKTTTTAHLGLAFAKNGYRVLVVDLDFQGSLTSMLLDQGLISELQDNKKLIQNFLDNAADYRATPLLDYCTPVSSAMDHGLCMDIVGGTDELAYSELSLSTRWLTKIGKYDTRFLLRRGLHLLGLKAKYDVVLIDCPPVVNISCVNALAASDYVLIPTTFSEVSINRVPQLLGGVFGSDDFKHHINPHILTPFIVANRVNIRGNEPLLSGDESDLWIQLQRRCQDKYGHIHRCDSLIPQVPTEIRESERAFNVGNKTTRLSSAFEKLAYELEGVFPSECRIATRAFSKSE